MASLKCDCCGKKIPRSGYKWLNKTWCFNCFCRERNKHLNDEEIEWSYELLIPEKSRVETLEAWM